MSLRGLRIRSVAAGTEVVLIGVDSPTRGVAILDITIGSTSSSAPLHWRAGDWSKPPLDVSLGSDGRAESIQVVFQDEAVLMYESDFSIDNEPGVPVFAVDGWPADRYVDARVVIRAKRCASDELAVSIGENPPVRRLTLGEGLHLGLDANGEVVEVLVGPLEVEQWRMIAAASS